MQLNKLFLIIFIGVFCSWSASAATRTKQGSKHNLKKVSVTKNHSRKSVAVRTKSISKLNYSPGRLRAQSYFQANPRSVASTSKHSKHSQGKTRDKKGKVAGNSKAKNNLKKSHR